MRTDNINRQTSNALKANHLMKKIREYDFAITETSLFLDTHPNNAKAVNYYNNLRLEREKYYNEYEKTYGPITMYGNTDSSNWNWTNGPWPWEKEC